MPEKVQGPPSVKVFLHLDVFEEMRAIQRMQEQSPRFDLRDLTSSALRLVLNQPDAARLILDKAQVDFANRLEKDS